MKQCRLSHRSYDYLAMNKELVTHAARYIFLQEIWRNGGVLHPRNKDSFRKR